MTGFVLMIAAGLALGGWNTWQRLGRTSAARSWSRGMRHDFVRRNVLVLWPLVAAALVLGGTLGLVQAWQSVTMVVGLLFLAASLLWLAYVVLPLPVPRFVQPRWYRRSHERPAGGRNRRA